MPTVIGWLRPVVLMPASALTGMGSEQVEAILAHELAHIRRHDYLVNLLQTVVETLLFSPSRGLVALFADPDRARELLRRPRGEPVW